MIYKTRGNVLRGDLGSVAPAFYYAGINRKVQEMKYYERMLYIKQR